MVTIERFGHGGDVWTAAEAFGRSSGEFVDFSANINPLGPPPSVMARLAEELAGIIHYPDPGHRRMKEALSRRLQVGSEQLLIGNGAAECMALAILAHAPRAVGVVAPCFSEYEALSRQFGADVVRVIGQASRDYLADWPDLERLMADADVVFLGQPNNPTGAVYERGMLEEAGRLAERNGTLLIMDEAFIDFLPDEEEASLLRFAAASRNVLVIRSLTKFYAIPGLRLGYAAGHPDTIRALASKQVTWSVNGLALAAGEALLLDEAADDYAERTRSLIAGEREWLSRQLTALGLRLWTSRANFLLVEAAAPWSARSLQEELGRRGVLIRNCDGYAGLGAGHFRIAVKDRQANKRLVEALQAVLHL
ncbi:threonine-phosphate decarboxylase CobD [Paenibacillus thiaminolyticus]|uniref:threonine-phosphate decarboxylase CobD n=1 Tax=Paenibacillus thiaminolyticus TaxID=49283 RepID=UPI00254345B3|nr:threonine-phosphate decarboxylase CobD [Paenibacillus thiaminolyticus]WII36641.1 threonine-phosphate decarboxylase CobD [Paenibacillus thiaminolyticus]